MYQFKLLHLEDSFLICIKPPRVRSTDEPGGVPDLCREALGDPCANVRTVHRLDQVVSGLMVLARSRKSASELSRQIREDEFEKEYVAVVHGTPSPACGTMTDLLLRNKEERKTYVVTEPGKDVQEAILHYQTVATSGDISLVRIQLVTGRTHQIRCQFSSRGLPLVGDRKYSLNEDGCEIALWSYRLAFNHPKSGEALDFCAPPPNEYPWNRFKEGILWATTIFSKIGNVNISPATKEPTPILLTASFAIVRCMPWEKNAAAHISIPPRASRIAANVFVPTDGKTTPA